MRRFLLALLVCAACKHSTSSSSTSHTETSTVTDSTSSESGATTTVTTQTEGPGKTTTTVEDYGPPEEVMPSDTELSGSSADAGVPATQGVVSRPSHGPLVRRTVTVSEHGQETTETHQQAVTQGTAATETKAQAKADTKAQAASETKPAASCVGLGWLWGLILLAVAFVAWRLLKP